MAIHPICCSPSINCRPIPPYDVAIDAVDNVIAMKRIRIFCIKVHILKTKRKYEKIQKRKKSCLNQKHVMIIYYLYILLLVCLKTNGFVEQKL